LQLQGGRCQFALRSVAHVVLSEANQVVIILHKEAFLELGQAHALDSVQAAHAVATHSVVELPNLSVHLTHVFQSAIFALR